MLPAGMIGLYLYDSALLLASNEAILTAHRKDSWSALFGSDRFRIRGKEPFLPNPFLPHRPIFRFTWDTEGLSGGTHPWRPQRSIYAVFAPTIWIMTIALFVLIPLGLLSRLGNLAVSTGLIIFYVTAIVTLTMVWMKRGILGINGKDFASLAFSSLCCPPFALNLVRHLSLNSQPTEDFLSVIRRLLDAEKRNAAILNILDRLRIEIDWEDEGTPRADALRTHLQSLSHESYSCRAMTS